MKTSNRLLLTILAGAAFVGLTPVSAQVNPSSPWGITTAETGGTNGVAAVTIRDGGMTSFDPIAGIRPQPDARYRDRQIYNVAFLGGQFAHPSLADLQFCLQPVDYNNQVIGAEGCTSPGPVMTINIPVPAGTTRLLPIVRRGAGGERVAWGWQPERGTHAFQGWRAIFVHRAPDGTVRNATAAEVRASQ